MNFDMGAIVGSCATFVRLPDEAAAAPGVKGLMLTFDDFLRGPDKFGQEIQPLRECRQKLRMAAE